MKRFARMTALLGLAGVFGATAFGQAPATPPIAPTTGAKAPGTMVKGYTRKGKNGKMITVKPHMRAAKPAMMGAAKGSTVKGYTRKTKSGKTVAVKGYTRTAPKKPSMSTPPGQMKKM